MFLQILRQKLFFSAQDDIAVRPGNTRHVMLSGMNPVNEVETSSISLKIRTINSTIPSMWII